MQLAFPDQVSEYGWQLEVVKAARDRGWRVWYLPDWVYRLIARDFRTRRRADRDWPDKGFPDVWCVRGEPDGRGRLLVAELKSATGRVEPEQRTWLKLLGAVPGVEVYVWKPGDWAQTLAVLDGQPAAPDGP